MGFIEVHKAWQRFMKAKESSSMRGSAQFQVLEVQDLP